MPNLFSVNENANKKKWTMICTYIHTI
jgi:hypothetical protein